MFYRLEDRPCDSFRVAGSSFGLAGFAGIPLPATLVLVRVGLLSIRIKKPTKGEK
jgi:hypothetical protein